MKGIIKKYNYIVILLTILIPVVTILLNMIYHHNHVWNIDKFLYFYIGVCCLAIPIYIKEIFNFPKRILIPLIIFLEVVFIATMNSNNPSESFFGLGTPCISGYISFLAFTGVFVSAVTLDEKIIKTFTKMLVIIATFLAILSITKTDLTYYLFNLNRNANYTHMATFYQFNHYGYYLLITSLCSLYLFLKENFKSSIFYLFTTIILIYTLIVNNTMSVFLAFVFAFIIILIYCISKKKIKRIGILLIIFITSGLLLCLFNNNVMNIIKTNSVELIKDVNTLLTMNDIKEADQIGTARGILWRKGIEYWLRKPWSGYGVDNIRHLYLAERIGVDKPHNFIIELLTTSGIIGFLSYMFMLGVIFISVLKKRNKCKEYILFSLVICLSYLVSAFFGNSRLYTAPYFYIALGFCFKVLIDKDSTKNNKKTIEIE